MQVLKTLQIQELDINGVKDTGIGTSELAEKPQIMVGTIGTFSSTEVTKTFIFQYITAYETQICKMRLLEN
jgi:hypothetical protein